jgi:phosphoenolpyruvate phosphomutase / 2-hydroxyethylphosphonate cytidylyltransferase
MKICEASNGLMARIVEQSDYDGIWVSSLCHSASLGLPDNELVPLSDRVELVKQLRRVSTKPIIVDIDTGGDIEHLPFIIKWFEKAGANVVIMEDKKYPKQNSLLEEGKKDLEDVDVFSEKIKVCKENTKHMKVFARLESLIAKRSKYEAVLRARAYIESGADGIMVHSKTKVDATEVMEVGEEIRIIDPEITLIAVPTTYTLPGKHPFNIIITANHMTRASIKAMQKFVKGEEVELASVQDIFDLVGK